MPPATFDCHHLLERALRRIHFTALAKKLCGHLKHTNFQIFSADESLGSLPIPKPVSCTPDSIPVPICKPITGYRSSWVCIPTDTVFRYWYWCEYFVIVQKIVKFLFNTTNAYAWVVFSVWSPVCFYTLVPVHFGTRTILQNYQLKFYTFVPVLDRRYAFTLWYTT